MDLTNFGLVFQKIKSKEDFDDNYNTQKEAHGAFITEDIEEITTQFLDNPSYDKFEDQRQNRYAQVWRGKTSDRTAYIQDIYFQFTPSDLQWERYFQLFEQSYQNLSNNQMIEPTRHSLFHQQLCYSIPSNNCYLTIDTDVYIPVQIKTDENGQKTIIHLSIKEDDKLLISFMNLLRELFAKHLRVIMTDNLYQLKSDNPLFDYVITCRGKTDDPKNPDHQSKNTNFIRYGYHTYFYNLVMDSKTKSKLYSLVMTDLQNDQTVIPLLKERYQETFKLSEYLDKGPFTGTSSLPFSSGSVSSIYKFIISPQTNERLSLDKKPDEFKKWFMRLNPFKGFGIPLITASQQRQNIITIMRKQENYCSKYDEGIRFANQFIIGTIGNKDIIKWIYTNITLKLCHIYWDEDIDNTFIKNVYTLLNRNELLTELFFFIAMCEKPEDIIQGEDTTSTVVEQDDSKDGFQYNKERDRYPIKCHMRVQKAIKDLPQTPYSMIDQEMQIQTLIEWFNGIMKKRFDQQLTLNRPISEQITQNPYSTYQKFLDFISKQASGCLQHVPFENQRLDFIITQYNNFLYQTVFKNIRCVSKQGVNVSTHNDVLYEYIPIREADQQAVQQANQQAGQQEDQQEDDQQEAYYITPEQGHYQVLKTSKFISMMHKEYQNLIDDYGATINESNKFNQLCQTNDDAAPDLYDSRNKQLNIFQHLVVEQGNLSEQQCKKLVPKLIKPHSNSQEQPNTSRMIIGVYNGIIKYRYSKKNFQMLSNEQCAKYFQTQTTFFKVDPVFLNSKGFLISEDEFLNSSAQALEPYKVAYNKLMSILTDIFGDSQLCVFKWKLAMITHQILTKDANQHILFEYGTGGDGKSMNNEAIQYILGLSSSNQEHPYENETRKIQHIGYSTIAKSSILITSEKDSNKHDSAGFAELEQSVFANFAELPASQPISSSTIKRLAGGTSVTFRKAHAPDSTSMVNKTFIVLQTNNYPRVDQTLDDGFSRRVLFYKYPHKFVDQHTFDSAADKTNLRLKDFSLQNIFQENIYMVDMLGVFMLWSFLDSQKDVQATCHKPITMPEVPEIIVEQTIQFIGTYDVDCNVFKQNFLQVQTNSAPSGLGSDVAHRDAPQKAHCIKYETMRALIDQYCEENQIKSQSREVRANILHQINKTYMNNIRVYKRIKDIQVDGVIKQYCVCKFNINELESYTRQQDIYKIFYVGIKAKKGIIVNEDGLTSDDQEYAAIQNVHITRAQLQKIYNQLSQTSIMNSMLECD